MADFFAIRAASFLRAVTSSGVSILFKFATIHDSDAWENACATLGSSVTNIALACLGLNVSISWAVPWYITLGVPFSLRATELPNHCVKLSALVAAVSVEVASLTAASLTFSKYCTNVSLGR